MIVVGLQGDAATVGMDQSRGPAGVDLEEVIAAACGVDVIEQADWDLEIVICVHHSPCTTVLISASTLCLVKKAESSGLGLGDRPWCDGRKARGI